MSEEKRLDEKKLEEVTGGVSDESDEEISAFYAANCGCCQRQNKCPLSRNRWEFYGRFKTLGGCSARIQAEPN